MKHLHRSSSQKTMAKQNYGVWNLASCTSLNGSGHSLPASLSSLQEDSLNRYRPTSVPAVDISASSLTGANDDPEYYGYSYNPSWPSSSPIFESFVTPSSKRHSREVYHPTMYGGHNTNGQTESWYSTNALSKRSRTTNVSDILSYPQRPGEKICAHYMLTRSCKFGDGCKFDHPVWVPEGGIPDWKETPIGSTNETFPERPGEQDCPYYLKTQRCKYGSKCKFNHPNEILSNPFLMTSLLPDRPSEPLCTFYLKTGKCKFGAKCKFHHPKDIQIIADHMDNNEQKLLEGINDITAPELLISLNQNSRGLPLRPGEVDCPFYMKTGSCKYGSSCRFNHPDRNGINPPDSSLNYSNLSSFPVNYNTRATDPLASLYQVVDSVLSRSLAGSIPSIYPQRPGQMACDYYMKTGECKFGERCRFNHPVDRFAPLAKETFQLNVKLTLAGLPRREGAVRCPFYMKTGACKYGANCKFDHPPPGEVVAQGVTYVDEQQANDEAEV